MENNITHDEKNRVSAGLFAILLGAFGVHKFYLGEKGKGILFLLFFWTGVPSILGLIDGISILSMSDTTFNNKYN